MSSKKTVREQGIERILPHIVFLGRNLMTKMEYEILTEVLVNNKKFTELNSVYQLTAHRLGQIFDRAIRQFTIGADEIRVKLDSHNNLLQELSAARNELASVTKKVVAVERKAERKQRIPVRIRKLLPLSIQETSLSVRVKNICAHERVLMIGHLVTFTRQDFLKLRNCGKGSADEVEVFLKSKGLSWGMQF